MIHMAYSGKKGMTPQKRVIALLHSFCHIESFAIDLSWDVLCRFILSNNQISLKPTSTDSTNETTATTTTTDPTTAPAQPAEKTQSDIVLVADEGGDSDDTKEQGRKQPETVVLPVLPEAFFEDWLRIAGEEALHYGLWRDRYGTSMTHTIQ